ncbi:MULTISPECIES: HNH endonuclease signature motif containing protein [Microbacterium]|uniref:HNH endonuclease n=1 Tax=Microbacterium TaxID=33882 RepID=UPI002782D861|nr:MULTISPECIES: HNH endonuclease signature motif containing protein [Microbacterium]MDQ1084988.1 hypothetical protein [Microbacterium sp. SORGH_AS_0344]MDQ1169737.1 hypothetical protein [Microbacterium proteolyticum]
MTDLRSPDAAPPGEDESARLRELVQRIRAGTTELARVHAGLIRHRAAVMQIAMEQVTRSPSRSARERELPVRSVALDIAAATQTHDLTVQKELGEAHTLIEKFAATVDALESGRIGMRHTQAILDTGAVIDDDDTRRGWEQVVLTRAERDSPGRTRAFARELAESVQPVGMTARHARAAEERGVSVRDLADGMAELSVILPATVAYGIRDRLRRQAAAIRAACTVTDVSDTPQPSSASGGPLLAADPADTAEVSPAGGTTHADAPSGVAAPSTLDGTAGDTAGDTAGGAADTRAVRDERTLAQIGADLCADLLLTGAPTIDPTDDATCPGGLGAIRGQVQITVPVLTLLGRTDVGAALAGRSPIDPCTARWLAARAPGWDRVMCDPVAGTVLEVDRYSPTAAQRRYLAARDQHCRAPGCRAPLTRCQIDHNHEAQDGGATTLSNLAHLCVRHHTLKTETAWTVSQQPDGTLRFTSPLGQKIEEAPPPRVLFLPDGGDAGHSARSDPPPF